MTENNIIQAAQPRMPPAPAQPEIISMQTPKQPQQPVNYVAPTTLLLIPTNQIYRTAVSPIPESIDLQAVEGIPVVKNDDR